MGKKANPPKAPSRVGCHGIWVVQSQETTCRSTKQIMQIRQKDSDKFVNVTLIKTHVARFWSSSVHAHASHAAAVLCQAKADGNLPLPNHLLRLLLHFCLPHTEATGLTLLSSILLSK